jgi:hypothetical protein
MGFSRRRVAVSGVEPSLADPGEVSGLGEVYYLDGTYRVVVVSERRTVDNVAIPFVHSWAQGIGLAWLVGLGSSPGRGGGGQFGRGSRACAKGTEAFRGGEQPAHF